MTWPRRDTRRQRCPSPGASARNPSCFSSNTIGIVERLGDPHERHRPVEHRASLAQPCARTNAQQNTPALSSYFELMDRFVPSFLNALSSQKVRGTRVLLKSETISGTRARFGLAAPRSAGS
jgi:hypothetical protein